MKFLAYLVSGISLGSIYARISRRTQPAVFLMDDMYATVACRPFITEAWTIVG